MTDKKSFGLFIKEKRIEKNYTQKDLAEMLFVTEGAVSKWERGVSYPDITMIPDICRVLEISEHELITASTDTETRKTKKEAKKYQIIRNAWILIPTISYSVALFVCFICNLAVNHTLSWFFIVLSALVCAYTFIPTVTHFFGSNKLLVFVITTYLSICLLLLTCSVYTKNLSWLLTACIGILLVYAMIFLPLILSKTCVSRFKFIISFASAFVLTALMLLNINAWHPFMLVPAILLTCFGFAPALVCTVVCAFRFDAILKAGICSLLCGFVYYFTGHLVNKLFGLNENHYQVNFSDWNSCASGNVQFIVFAFVILVGTAFITIGIYRLTKTKSNS